MLKRKKRGKNRTTNAPGTRRKTELLQYLGHANPLDNSHIQSCYPHRPIGPLDNSHKCLIPYFLFYQLRNQDNWPYQSHWRHCKQGNYQEDQDLLREDKIQWDSLRTQSDLLWALQTYLRHTLHTYPHFQRLHSLFLRIQLHTPCTEKVRGRRCSIQPHMRHICEKKRNRRNTCREKMNRSRCSVSSAEETRPVCGCVHETEAEKNILITHPV